MIFKDFELTWAQTSGGKVQCFSKELHEGLSISFGALVSTHQTPLPRAHGCCAKPDLKALPMFAWLTLFFSADIFNYSVSQLCWGLRCCSRAVTDQASSCWAWYLAKSPKLSWQTWDSTSFSPKSKWLWDALPHKGPFEAVGTSWQGCLCLPTDGQAFYFSKHSCVEGWSLDPANILRDRASLGQERSDVRALHSSWA